MIYLPGFQGIEMWQIGQHTAVYGTDAPNLQAIRGGGGVIICCLP